MKNLSVVQKLALKKAKEFISNASPEGLLKLEKWLEENKEV